MPRIVIIIGFITLLFSTAQAQLAEGPFGYYQDALLFGRTYQGGTARMQGIGGAQVSLGGDINSAFSNPAGLGFLRSGVITITPAIDVNATDSNYEGSSQNDFKGNFNFSNLGIAFAKKNTDTDSKIKGGSFAITLTRKNNFHSNITYEGINENAIGNSSIVDAWLNNANNWNGNAPLSIETLPDMEYYALQQGLIVDYYDDNGNLTEYVKWIGDQPVQYEEIQRTGAQYEWNFAGGVNYNDIFYFGGGLAISTINYFSKATYEEYDFFFDGALDESIEILSTQTTTTLDGAGVGANIGLIVRPIDYFRLGITINTPTFYGINENISSDLLTRYNWEFVDLDDGSRLELNEEYFDEFEPTVTRYTLTTPWKFSAGSSFFLGKLGFISADIDYVDYASSRIRSNDFNGFADTEEVNNVYSSTINYRIGSEIRLENFRFRAGYGYDGDPIKESNIDNSIRRISGGIGYRNNAFFTDLAVVHTKTSLSRQPYFGSPLASIDNNNVNVSVTFGVNF